MPEPTFPDFANHDVPMPFAPWTLPREYTTRTQTGVTVTFISGEAEAKAYRAAVINELNGLHQAKAKALEGGNVDAYNAALGQELALAVIINNAEPTGNSQRPERDGLWLAGWAVCLAKRNYAPECIGLKVDPAEVQARAQRVRSVGNLLEDVDNFRATLDDYVAGEERELAAVVRAAHGKLETQAESNLGLRRTVKPIVDYATGAAKQAAEQARKNRRLVASTRAEVLSGLKDSIGGGGAATPPATPATPPAVTPPAPTHVKR